VSCVFCRIRAKSESAHVVYEDSHCLAFLDHRPLFLGHTLVVPSEHVETIADLPVPELAPFFSGVQRVTRAVERGLAAEGSFVAMNNRVSQSVPHLHVHVVPRRKGDGLRGFFWPRQKVTAEELARARDQIVASMDGR
jgi:histidine triad (HIT) family protein